MLSLLTVLCLSGSALASGADGEGGHDKYPNFAALARSEREGVDYRITLEDRHASRAVFAIHGGKIEQGSAELARLIAGADRSVYAFEGIKSAHNWDLHVTSAHFDEPRALELASRAKTCVSVHGFAGGANTRVACVGGGNASEARDVATALGSLGSGGSGSSEFLVEFPCARFAGTDATNIVNRCAQQGVQIEMSAALRKALAANAALARRFAEAVRAATPER